MGAAGALAKKIIETRATTAMSTLRIDRLQRLVRITGLIYRQQSVEVARLRAEQADLERASEGAAGMLDRSSAMPPVVVRLALLRALRTRQQVDQANARLGAQLETASAALGGLKSAESRLADEARRLDRATAERALDDLMEIAAHRRAASLE